MRVKTDIKRSAEIVDGKVILSSSVTEEMTKEQFMDQYMDKLNQINRSETQLEAIKKRLKQLETQIPDQVPDDFIKFKEYYELMQTTQEYEQIKENAQTLEIQVNTLKEDCMTFKQIEKKI